MTRPPNTQTWDGSKPYYMRRVHLGAKKALYEATRTGTVKDALNKVAIYSYATLAGWDAPENAYPPTTQALTDHAKQYGLDPWDIEDELRRALTYGKAHPRYLPLTKGQPIPATPAVDTFVRTYLTTNGPTLRAELRGKTIAEGHSDSGFKRALRRLGIRLIPVEGGKDNAKMCYLPEQAVGPPQLVEPSGKSTTVRPHQLGEPTTPQTVRPHQLGEPSGRSTPVSSVGPPQLNSGRSTPIKYQLELGEPTTSHIADTPDNWGEPPEPTENGQAEGWLSRNLAIAPCPGCDKPTITSPCRACQAAA